MLKRDEAHGLTGRNATCTTILREALCCECSGDSRSRRTSRGRHRRDGLEQRGVVCRTAQRHHRAARVARLLGLCAAVARARAHSTLTLRFARVETRVSLECYTEVTASPPKTVSPHQASGPYEPISPGPVERGTSAPQSLSQKRMTRIPESEHDERAHTCSLALVAPGGENVLGF
eukprot:946503-Pleurochrysis_carterae.AAC.1